ncbi:uncharacterized protein LOC116852262 isoform X2 [Odontomachus brunneus]|uniref:uncharacterized protein LOC116852262 isoform X2 n=1 Tax=Odontomachus brunneus TaxID=486640 RepID=UPI0013F20C9B|nr:uncharacterized protein LOC116852262 isoform X2 [Odontomachus brunneus]
MEEDDEEVSLTCTQRRKSSIPGLSIYQSVQNSLNQGSEQTLYESVRNTLYEDVISMNSMHSAVSLENIRQIYTDDLSTINNDTDETIIDGSYTDVKNSMHNSRLLSHSGTKYSLYFRDEIRSIDFVLVWDEYNGEAQTYHSVEHRKSLTMRKFEENMLRTCMVWNRRLHIALRVYRRVPIYFLKSPYVGKWLHHTWLNLE